MNNILPRKFYQRDTVQVSKDLLGKLLVHKINKNIILSGIISETEAYTSQDEACHGYKGQTDKNKSLFGPVGHTYVYLSYGIHYCLNIVAHNKNECKGGGVLIRSLIPQQGIDYMFEQRKSNLKNLTNGPGKVGQAFSITLAHDGIDITHFHSSLFLTEGINVNEQAIKSSKRIGITKNAEVLWRFFIAS